MASQGTSQRSSHCVPHWTGGESVRERALDVVNCVTQRYLSLVFSICCYSTSTVYDGDAENGTELTALLPRARGDSSGGGGGGRSGNVDDGLDDSAHRGGDGDGDDGVHGAARTSRGGSDLRSQGAGGVASTPTPGPSSAGEPQPLFAVPLYDPGMDLP